jgi:hypothetical protein
MAFDPELLITRQPIVDRNRQIAFHRLSILKADAATLSPFMLRLANIDIPQAVYFLPISWVEDAVLLNKLARDMILTISQEELSLPVVEQAKALGFRTALVLSEPQSTTIPADFVLAPWATGIAATPDTIYTGIESIEQEKQAKATMAMYYSGNYLRVESMPVPGGKRINPSHALILELMNAVQQEAEPKAIEALFKRDVTLSFKLLRYINSPWFGLAARIESIRHALSIIGYQQLLKWLTLLAATAGSEVSPLLTLNAMIRARFMELIGAKLVDKYDTDNLFMTGMLSLLDHLMGVPMEDILKFVNLPPTVTETLMGEEGRYSRYLKLAKACEQTIPPALDELSDIDIKLVNNAHIEAIEWATQACKTM